MEMNGFWLPTDIQAQLLNPDSEYTELAFTGGREVPPATPGAVHARWPKLNPHQWKHLIALLKANRARVPSGEQYWERLLAALRAAGERLSDPQDALNQQALRCLPDYCGFSEAMIHLTLNAFELVSLGDLPQAFKMRPSWDCARSWQRLEGLPGWIRFYPHGLRGNLPPLFPGRTKRSLFAPASPAAFVTG